MKIYRKCYSVGVNIGALYIYEVNSASNQILLRLLCSEAHNFEFCQLLKCSVLTRSKTLLIYREYGSLCIRRIIFQAKASRTHEASKRPAYEEGKKPPVSCTFTFMYVMVYTYIEDQIAVTIPSPPTCSCKPSGMG
jgi:hypothetical protein